jgi:flagellar biosynthesis/type III secretory pathway chaperone
LKIYDETVETLSRHLCAEIECLELLLETLDCEAKALRELSLDELDEVAPRKEKLVSRQAVLSRRRSEILSNQGANGPVQSLSELLNRAELSHEHPLVVQIIRLRDLAANVVEANYRNRIFAQSGNGLVSGLVQMIDSWRSPRARTYARNGHIRRNLLDSTPRGTHPCSA